MYPSTLRKHLLGRMYKSKIDFHLKKIAEYLIPDDEGDEIGLMQWSALILFYFKEDTDEMDDDKFAKRIAQLDYALKKTNQYGK